MTGFRLLALAALIAGLVAGGCASTGTRPPSAAAGDAPATQQEGLPPGQGADAPEKDKTGWGPWMVTPLFSSTPKLGTSLGVLGGALHYFDEKSRVSMFGLSAQYTSTDSMKVVLMGKTSFGEDRHRVKFSASEGRIMNDYEDYLGTGIALSNVENARGVSGSYLYRVSGNWFAGAQGVFKNYQVVGQSPSDAEALAALGIKGLRSGGLGAVVQNDTRDNDNRPTRGWLVNADNIAFRTRLGGDYDYDLYRFDLRGYWGHGRGHVLAVRQANQWTVDAPLEAQSSINLRGYKSGQYLGENVSSIEVEERFQLARRWGATLFLGAGCLYGGGESCTDHDNLYPSFGGGIQFVLVPKEGVLANLEYGRGKGSNSGVYVGVGYDF